MSDRATNYRKHIRASKIYKPLWVVRSQTLPVIM